MSGIKFKNLNNEKLIQKREEGFKTLENIYSGSDPENVFSINGYVSFSSSEGFENPKLWVRESLNILDKNAENLFEDKNEFNPLCIEFGPYGVHFIDKILNAEVFFKDGQWYNEYLKTQIGELKLPDLDKNETWNMAKSVALEFVESGAKLPLFGLPTIASALNIAVNLYGENILTTMYLDPEKAKHDLETINNLLCTLHKWYIDNIPYKQLQPVISWERTQPHGYGQLCGCTNQLVSPQMYKEFLAPLDERLLSVYPNGGMIHLCGSHSQHIPVWREMKSVRALQLNDRAAEDLELYYKGLRNDQILYVMPCEGMSAKEAVKITGGHRLVIQRALDSPIKIKNKCNCTNC